MCIIRPTGNTTSSWSMALAVRTECMQPGLMCTYYFHSTTSTHPNARHWGRFDSSALHIRHALNATEVQRKYSRPHEKPIETYLVRALGHAGTRGRCPHPSWEGQSLHCTCIENCIRLLHLRVSFLNRGGITLPLFSFAGSRRASPSGGSAQRRRRQALQKVPGAA